MPSCPRANYSLTASATGLANTVGTTFATATSLGSLGTTPVVKSDWIGGAAPNDYYQFSVGSLSTVSLQFGGAADNNETLTLLDRSGNVIDSITGYSSNQPNTLIETLGAGVYYLKVNDSTNTVGVDVVSGR